MKDIAERIQAIMQDCLYNDKECAELSLSPHGHIPPPDSVVVDGIVRSFAFHPGRLQKNKEKIAEILREMPANFQQKTGGGWSFLNLCMDKNGDLWGQHPNMEELVVLGIATKQAAYCLPKELWNALPGGMPYVVFDT